MPILLGIQSATEIQLADANYVHVNLAIVSAPTTLRRGSSYTISMIGVGTNLANITADLGGAPITVTSTDGSTVGITIPSNIARKHSNGGLPITVTVAGVGSVSSAEIPFLPPVGWSFIDLVNPLPSSDDRSITYNMVNDSGSPVNAVTNDQIVSQNPLVVDANGTYGVDRDGIAPTSPISYQAYLIEVDGTVGQTATKTITYQDGADTTPNAFSFPAQSNSPLGQWVISNAITVQNVDPGLDVPVSVSGGEYQVSTNNGGTWGAFTSANTNVQLNYQIRVRVMTSASYADPRTVTLTVGGVSAEFTATTAIDPSLAPAITLTAQTFIYPPGQSGSSSNVNKILLDATLLNIAPSPVTFQVRDTINDPWQTVTTDASAPYSAGYSTTFIPDGTVKRFRANVVHNGDTIYSDEVTAVVDNAPVVTMTAPSGVQAGPFNVHVSFSESVTGITAGSFTLTNGAVATSISGSGSQYVLAVTPPGNSAGSTTITLPTGSGEDSGGNAITGLNAVLGGVRQVSVQYDTTQVVTNPQILSIGGDNIIQPGETVTIIVQDITLANIDQVVLANNGGSEYAIPFNGTAQVTIPTFIPAGTYTLRLREFN